MIDSVLTLLSHPHDKIRGEALYVVCNAINIGESDHIKMIFELKGYSLVQPMTEALVRGHEAHLTVNILQALIVLLNLDL